MANTVLVADENISLLHELSVVIPTFNRHEFVLRQLRYWSNTGAEVIIVDGSKEPLAQHALNKFGFSNLIYLHAQDTFNERLKLAAKKITRTYAVHCSDDDFLLFSGIISCIKRLKSNKKLIACSGQTIKINPYRTRSLIDYGAGYRTLNYEIRSKSVAKRLKMALSNYKPVTFYAVMPKDIFTETWGNIQDNEFAMVQEFEQIITTYICGDVATVKDLTRLWSVEVFSVSDPSQDRQIKIEDWWTNNYYEKQKQKFVSKLSNTISSKYGYSYIKSSKILLSALDCYFKNPLQFNPKPNSLIDIFNWKIKKIANRLLPQRMIFTLKKLRLKVLRILINRRNPLWRKLEYGNIKKLMLNSDSIPCSITESAYKELKMIEALIFDHYSKDFYI